MYPTLAEWRGGICPDEINPRSHEENVLDSHVAKDIRTTIEEAPADFFLANRGGTILAYKLHYDANTGLVEIDIPDPELYGMADGATTDAVIASVQNRLADGKKVLKLLETDMPDNLNQARFHIEVITGLTEEDKAGRIQRMAKGRNTSRQVKGWSMNDFRGEFDWLKDLLDRKGGKFCGKIAWEENSPQEVNVLDVLSITTLFHPDYASGDEQPTVAYSNIGTLDKRMITNRVGYLALKPIIEDILTLHDYIYVQFPMAYVAAKEGKKAKLGKRIDFQTKETILPLTGSISTHVISRGVLYPLLAAFRALISYKDGNVCWIKDPYKFFDAHSSKLVSHLIKSLENDYESNPQTMGKKPGAYENMYLNVLRYLH